MPGRKVQWDKDDCEDMGIVKIYLLGLGMLAAIEHALEIRSRRGAPVDLAIGNWKAFVAARMAYHRLRDTVIALAASEVPPRDGVVAAAEKSLEVTT